MASGRLDEGQLKTLKEEVLYGQIHYLSEELGDPGRYFPFLKSKGVLDNEDCDRIRAKDASRTKVEEFVERLYRRQSSRGDPAFDVLVDALKKQKVQAHIARALQRAFAKRKAEEERRKSAEMRQLGDPQGTPVSDIGTPLSAPVQASLSRSSTPSREATRKMPTQLASPTTEVHHSTSPNSETKFDIHPEHGAIPPPPPRAEMQHPPLLFSEDIDPTHGILPPPPPPSSTGLTTARPETTVSHQDSFEPGMHCMRPIPVNGERPVLQDSAMASGKLTFSQELPLHTWLHQGKQLGKSLHFLHPAAHGKHIEPFLDEPLGLGAQGQSEGQPPSFDSVDESVSTLFSESSPPVSGSFLSTEEKCHKLEKRVEKLQRENNKLLMRNGELQRQVDGQNSEIRDLQAVKASWQKEATRLQRELDEVKDYDELQKELQQVKEKLRHVTLSYHEHTYETMQHSDLDSYFEMKEESGKLLKQVEEQKSLLESLGRERRELQTQVEDFHRENQRLLYQLRSLSIRSPTQNHGSTNHSRPHHLPITSPAMTPPSYYHHHELRDTPLSLPGVTPPRSIHIGDQLSRHNVHLQQPSPPPPAQVSSVIKRHSEEGCLTPVGGDSLSLRSSNTSLSSHGSLALPSLGTNAQTTLV